MLLILDHVLTTTSNNRPHLTTFLERFSSDLTPYVYHQKNVDLIFINNSVFEKNSRFFRDALVRANYTNIKKKVYADNDPLERFFSNLLLGTDYELKSPHIRYVGPAKTGHWEIHKEVRPSG